MLKRLCQWIVKGADVDNSEKIITSPPAISEPISESRVQFIEHRLQVLEACVKELSRRKAYFHQALGCSHEQVLSAMAAFKSEELQLSVELQVLQQFMLPKGE